MPKYWGKQIFTHGRFPEVKSRRRKRKKKKRRGKKVGENNGQLRFVQHHGWRTQARLDQNYAELVNYVIICRVNKQQMAQIYLGCDKMKHIMMFLSSQPPFKL